MVRAGQRCSGLLVAVVVVESVVVALLYEMAVCPAVRAGQRRYLEVMTLVMAKQPHSWCRPKPH